MLYTYKLVAFVLDAFDLLKVTLLDVKADPLNSFELLKIKNNNN